MEKIFKIGDTVRLKSGGPLMTINNNIDEIQYEGPAIFYGEVECKWFDNKNTICKEIFKQDALEESED
ncbi:YodC family protein [Flavobacterium sp. GP15]|uniref:YodC family protein n=1 Tax=Flavobacterium sp. GP15 TaxID=2758567 RepID=UPI00165E2801|nr:DUF2158 domain-containing protein [Flavobacterium sp. GP15]